MPEYVNYVAWRQAMSLRKAMRSISRISDVSINTVRDGRNRLWSPRNGGIAAARSAASITTAEAAAATASSGSGEAGFALFGRNRSGHELDGHQIWLQRTVCTSRAAAGFNPPFGEVASDIERSRIVAA